jgi:cob(I)alamin adenosyltransferase
VSFVLKKRPWVLNRESGVGGGQSMKIYTGAGDRGKTGLFSGERVLKCDDRIEAYGDVDELVSVVGVVAAAVPSARQDLEGELQAIQSVLLQIGAWLATTPGSKASELLPSVSGDGIAALEAAIDRMEAELPTLRGFILPGGHSASAWAHVARTVCRRAERRVVRLFLKKEDCILSPDLELICTYVNRLSDYLFVLARYLNHVAGVPDKRWIKQEEAGG